MEHIPNASAEDAPATPSPPPDIYDEVAYAYDGSLEGLLSAVFAAYERHEHPTDIAPEERLQLRLGQRVSLIPTDQDRALRVMGTLRRQCGRAAALAVTPRRLLGRARVRARRSTASCAMPSTSKSIAHASTVASAPPAQAAAAWGRAPSSGAAPSRTSRIRPWSGSSAFRARSVRNASICASSCASSTSPAKEPMYGSPA